MKRPRSSGSDRSATIQQPAISSPGHTWSAPDNTVAPQIKGYRVLDRLGRGGMGTVWRAEQLSTKQIVALKIMDTANLGSATGRVRFEREVELTARLDHPHIARVYDSGVDRGIYYYIMELVEGIPLDHFSTTRALPRREILVLIQTVCEAVQHAHQRGVIHRDLKPSNILVTDHGRPYVLDFGLAKTLFEQNPGAAISQEGDIPGTVAYMSPEQAAGEVEQVDTRTDVYALGVILYRLLFDGEHPHDLSGPQVQVRKRIAENEIRWTRDVGKTVDTELAALLHKALAKAPENRYASAGELARDIENYLQGEPLIARRPTVLYFVYKRLRKYRVPATIAAVVIIGAISLVTVGYFRERRLRERALVADAIAHRAIKVLRGKIAHSSALPVEPRVDFTTRRAPPEAQWLERARYAHQVIRARAAIQVGDRLEARRCLALCPDRFRHWEWFYLWRLVELAPVSQFPDTQSVRLAVLSFDWQSSTTPIADGMVNLWVTQRTDMWLSVLRYQGSVHHIALSPDGLTTAHGSHDTTIKLLDVQTGREQATLRGHQEPVHAVAYSRDGLRLISGSMDQTIRLWDTELGVELMTLRGHRAPVRFVAFSPDGHRIISVDDDAVVKIWDSADLPKIAF